MTGPLPQHKYMRMEKSLQIRKEKALARARHRRRFAQGKLRLEDVSIAATAGSQIKESPLILRRVKLPQDEGC